MPRKIKLLTLATILAFGAMFFNFQITNAQEKKPVYFFWGDGCPHCHAEQVFWNKINDNYPDIEWIAYETWKNEEGYKIMQTMTKAKFGKAEGRVPLTIIGEEKILGFRDEETTGVEIMDALDKYTGVKHARLSADTTGPTGKDAFKFPLIGTIDAKKLSLPILTAALGAIDGFNPCSMWALLVMITLLINAGDKKKMWLVGCTYIAASAFSYFLFLTAWFNAFVQFGYLQAVKIIIGLLAVGVGGYFLRDYYRKRKQDRLTCEVTSEKTKGKIIERLEKTLKKEKTLAIIIGITLIAFSINLVELLCSAGIPAVYTQILSQNELPKISYYLYLLGYDFFYMLDDIIVLLIAGFTWKMFTGNQKYAKYSHLIGGLLLVVLGIIMIFRPGLLMFK
ncbi:hypothetical protein GYA13_03520 [Candidatus Kuenenbacteria bacterium]|nr:hypothetical protein [Candidatus Kuenenbacteria bacterium]